jgi:hypothetical protein
LLQKILSITFASTTFKVMTQHEEEKNYDYIYYIVAIVSGMFTGAIIEKGLVWILVGAVLGFLSAALYIRTLAKSSHD